jgi:hypothetical protein
VGADRATPPSAVQPHAVERQEATEEAQAVKKPFVIREAKLPEGFPPPGTVGQVILKHYPAYRAARVRAEQISGGPNAMFNPLFRHIQRSDIAMTAPVEMSYDTTDIGTPVAEAMAFLYQSTSIGRPGVDGADARIIVEDFPAITVLSFAFRGPYNARSFAAGNQRLQAWLEEHPGAVEPLGLPRMLAYNSPFVPGFLKIGEVQLPVRVLSLP